MPTTPTTRVTSLARSHRLDIDTATYPASAYNQLYGVEDMKLVEDLRVEEDEMYDDDGAMRETNTGYSWRIEVKIAYSTNAAGNALDTVHAFLRNQFKLHRSTRVENAEFGVRIYNRDGLEDEHNHEGRVYVKSWSMPGGKGGDRIDIVLQGQGPLADITNPAGNPDPVVTAVSPTGGSTAGGELVNVYGYHFTGATAVDFGATAADDFTVVSDSHIVAIAPAHAAGTVQTKVTTPEGASADTAADNYTYA